MNEETIVKAITDAVEVATDSVKSELEGQFQTKIADLEKEVSDLKLLKESKGDQSETKSIFAKAFKQAKKGDFGLMKATYLNETTDSEGGYVVPEEFASEVLYKVATYGVARRLCRVIPMGTDAKNIAAVVGGVTIYFTDEGTGYTQSKPTLGQVKLVAKKITALIPSTFELIDDSQTDDEIWELVTTLVAEAMAAFEDAQVFTGDGTGSNFIGLTSLAGVNVVTTSGNAFNTLTYQNLIDAIYSTPSKYLNKNCKFFMDNTVIGLVHGLKDNQNRPILEYVGPNGLPTILGYGVEIVDSLPGVAESAANKKFIVFGDLSNYGLGSRKDLTIDFGYQSGEREKDIQSMKASKRIACKALFADAFSLIKSAS